jgi:hypothetical protein
VKRHPSLRDLSDDHHTALVVGTRCARAMPEDAAQLWKIVRALTPLHFEPHFAIEEQQLLPALEALGEATMVARIRSDHARLRALSAQTDPGVSNVRDFGELLVSHVRYEEREVFEGTQERLPAAVLGTIETACREVARSCPVELRREMAAGR